MHTQLPVEELVVALDYRVIGIRELFARLARELIGLFAGSGAGLAADASGEVYEQTVTVHLQLRRVDGNARNLWNALLIRRGSRVGINAILRVIQPLWAGW